MIREKLTAQDKRVLEIADRYVHTYVESLVYKTQPVDWREYYRVAKRQLMTYTRPAHKTNVRGK